MKKSALVCSVLLFAAGGVRADEPKAPVVETPPAAKEWKIEGGADYFSEYVFRGVEVSDDEALFMPHVLAAWKGFTATFYGYYSDWGLTGSRWYTEHDYTLDYTHKIGKFAITAGALYYQYPNGDSGIDTWDLYTVVTYDFPLLNPKVTLNWDIDEFHTGYGTAGISHAFDLTKTLGLKGPMSLSVTPSGAIGIDFGYNSRASESNIAFNDVLLGLSTTLAVNETISIHAGVQLSIALDALNDRAQGNELIGNVGVAFTF